ncbi:MAG: N-acetylmuramoyl-L-alanine amidase [Rhodobacteraceae bacterium]|nr:N-acetylmuramoyl-L-alanine amidase [Paracoccaceae bacterium]
MIVLHYTAMVDAEAALARLCDPGAEVSAHYLIARDGRLFQMVEEGARAWHAGAGQWGAVCDVNSRSIGIELDNDGAQPFSQPLMQTLEGLLPGIMARWGIGAPRVIAHSDMAPGRKSDPGRRFDWRRLARQGLSIWPDPDVAPADPTPPDEAMFRVATARIGYGADWPTADVLEALRQRFRPWAHGPLGAEDMALARTLARRFPVDAPPASS